MTPPIRSWTNGYQTRAAIPPSRAFDLFLAGHRMDGERDAGDPRIDHLLHEGTVPGRTSRGELTRRDVRHALNQGPTLGLLRPMRSRPKITVYLTPSPALPGQRFRAELVLESTSDTPCDAITLTLIGEEKRYWRTRRSNNSSRRVYHERSIVAVGAKFPGALLSPGKHTRRAVFDLPPNASPTYRSEFTEIAYLLSVRVDIPWWPDSTADYTVAVAPLPARARTSPVTRFTSHTEPQGKELYIEASFSTLDAQIGQVIEGVVSLTNVAHHRVTQVDVALVAIESPLVESSAGPAEVARTTWTVSPKAPRDGESVRFALKIPKGMPPALETPFIAVTHQFEIAARVTFSADAQILVPVRILPAGSEDAAGVAPAAVGDKKRAANWQRALAGLGRADASLVSFDADTEEVVLSCGGRTLVVYVEKRGKEGSFLVARAAWPSLGLGLVVRDRRWKDIGGIDVDDAWDDRFVVRGRDAAQVVPFLDARTRAFLQAFADVSIEDREGRVAVKGSAHVVEALTAFLRAAIDFDAWMSTGYERVASPVPLAAAKGAWRAFAQKWSATFHPGDFSVDRLSSSGVDVIVRHRFEGATPKDTVIEVPPIASLKLPPDFAETATAALGRRVAVTEQGVVQVWGELALDPSVLEPVIEGLGAALRKLVTGERVGPYR